MIIWAESTRELAASSLRAASGRERNKVVHLKEPAASISDSKWRPCDRNALGYIVAGAAPSRTHSRGASRERDEQALHALFGRDGSCHCWSHAASIAINNLICLTWLRCIKAKEISVSVPMKTTEMTNTWRQSWVWTGRRPGGTGSRPDLFLHVRINSVQFNFIFRGSVTMTNPRAWDPNKQQWRPKTTFYQEESLSKTRLIWWTLTDYCFLPVVHCGIKQPPLRCSCCFPHQWIHSVSPCYLNILLV